LRWKYEPDELPKRKHAWAKPEPGFESHGTAIVGKCPNNISIEEAESLLNLGVQWIPEGSRAGWPKRIYIIHKGWVYRAMPTNPGVSYHAFPERPEDFRRLPREVRNAVLECAKARNCYDEVKRWMNR
jgi:hypothetical protein